MSSKNLFKFLRKNSLHNFFKSPSQIQFEKIHQPVMVEEVTKILIQQEKNLIQGRSLSMIDCTFGTGAHSFTFLEKIPSIYILGIDLDEKLIEKAQEKVEQKKSQIHLVTDFFSNFNKYEPGNFFEYFTGRKTFDVLFADLGYNIEQINNSDYGLSYSRDEKLDMRYNKQLLKVTAQDILNKFGESEIQFFLSKYGGIRKAHIISDAIVKMRKEQKIETSNQLNSILENINLPSLVPQVYQSLRIAVNQEILQLEQLIKNLKCKEVDQLVIIITFHSLEEQVLKDSLKNKKKIIKILKMDVQPTEAEIKNNPRSRSAKLHSFLVKRE